MKEYITRREALMVLEEMEDIESGFAAMYEIPAADVAEVVRCCNCEFHDHDGTSGYCNYWRRWSNMSDFCSHGK